MFIGMLDIVFIWFISLGVVCDIVFCVLVIFIVDVV